MFISDIKSEFYEPLIGNKVLLIVHYDVDAVCASKILQYIFRVDNISYVLVPVRGIEELKRAYINYCREVKFVLCINCGGTIDLVDTLEPDDSVTFFVLDSHRPTDVCNVYTPDQVKLLVPPTDEEKIPDANEIFREDESDEEEEESGESDDEGNRQDRRHQRAERALLRRRERRQWEENRNQLLFTYMQYNYYGRSSAVVAFETAWRLSRDCVDTLWWALVGAQEQVLLGRVDSQYYVLQALELHKHVLRLSQSKETDRDNNDTPTNTAPHITFGKDLQLALYRHWTVEASLRYSRYSATNLRLWTLRGESKVRELLVEIGLPLAQSRQKFASMDLVLRKEFPQNLEKLGEKYHMDRIMGATFFLQYGYRGRYCAADFVYAIIAHLECRTKDKSLTTCFMEALDCLSRSNRNILEEGIEKCKTVLVTIFRQVQILLEMRQVISAGPFLYMVLQEGSQDVELFSNPILLLLLSQFALHAYVSSSRSKRAPSQPLVASAPLDPQHGTCLILGIPPVADESSNNFFGKAFEQAGERISARMNMDYFDTSMIQLKTEDRPKFFDSLTSLLC